MAQPRVRSIRFHKWLSLGVCFTFAGALAAVFLTGPHSVADVVWVAPFLVMAGFAIRLSFNGFFATPQGLLVRGLFRTQLLRWEQIAGVTVTKVATYKGDQYLPGIVFHADYQVSTAIPQVSFEGQASVLHLWAYARLSESSAARVTARIQRIIDDGKNAEE
jgi:hypothetical protein